jgi:hypothetical protein
MSKNKSSKILSSFSSSRDSSYKSSDKIDTDILLNNFNLLKSKKIDKRINFDKNENELVIKMLESIHTNIFDNCITEIQENISNYLINFLKLSIELKDDEDDINLERIEITIKKWKKIIKEILLNLKKCVNNIIDKYIKRNRIKIKVFINDTIQLRTIDLEELYLLIYNYINLKFSFEPLYINIDNEYNLIKHEKKHINVKTSYNLLYEHFYLSLLYNYVFKPKIDGEEIDHQVFLTIFTDMLNIMIAKIFIDSMMKYRIMQTQKSIVHMLSNKLNEDTANKVSKYIKEPLFNKIYRK